MIREPGNFIWKKGVCFIMISLIMGSGLFGQSNGQIVHSNVASLQTFVPSIHSNVPAVKTNSDLSHSDSPAANNDYIFFPSPLKEKVWHTSFGFTLTEMPVEITEEAQLRAPAIDYHVLRRLGKGFYLDGRINSQIVQNHFSIGPRWGMDLSNKFSFSLGDDLAWWFGILNVEGFKTKANGWMNYPGISLGYRLKRELLLTLREEAEISLSYQSKVGDQKLNHYNNQFVGWSTAVYLEQPFFSQTHVTLGLKIRYSKFYWQAWSLFSTFDRYLLYPEINVGFIL